MRLLLVAIIAFHAGWILSWQANVWAMRRRISRKGSTVIANLFGDRFTGRLD